MVFCSNGGDTLFIASVFGREILVMDPDTGQIINRLGTLRSKFYLNHLTICI